MGQKGSKNEKFKIPKSGPASYKGALLFRVQQADEFHLRGFFVIHQEQLHFQPLNMNTAKSFYIKHLRSYGQKNMTFSFQTGRASADPGKDGRDLHSALKHHINYLKELKANRQPDRATSSRASFSSPDYSLPDESGNIYDLPEKFGDFYADFGPASSRASIATEQGFDLSPQVYNTLNQSTRSSTSATPSSEQYAHLDQDESFGFYNKIDEASTNKRASISASGDEYSSLQHTNQALYNSLNESTRVSMRNSDKGVSYAHLERDTQPMYSELDGPHNRPSVTTVSSTYDTLNH